MFYKNFKTDLYNELIPVQDLSDVICEFSSINKIIQNLNNNNNQKKRNNLINQ